MVEPTLQHAGTGWQSLLEPTPWFADTCIPPATTVDVYCWSRGFLLEPGGRDATNSDTMQPAGDVFALTDYLIFWNRGLSLLELANVLCCGHHIMSPGRQLFGQLRGICYHHVLKMLEPTTVRLAPG